MLEVHNRSMQLQLLLRQTVLQASAPQALLAGQILLEANKRSVQLQLQQTVLLASAAAMVAVCRPTALLM